MYAVIETGGKQYKVSKGDIVDVELIDGVAKDEIVLDKVLMASDGKKVTVGQPYIEKGSVICNLIGQVKGPKTISFKYRRRKDSKTKKGHRQSLTRLEVKEIKVSP
ncbi:MAG: 50S ribosomal protein L21 [Candidatus Omnitrophica bacterium]|nr:50S ribosomal protein L21 [Candidatus Omnitrophota bacterium]